MNRRGVYIYCWMQIKNWVEVGLYTGNSRYVRLSGNAHIDSSIHQDIQPLIKQNRTTAISGQTVK